MSSTDAPYDVQVAPAAPHGLSKLEKVDRDRIRRALQRLAVDVTKTGRGGKAIKTTQGTSDRFRRLRAGDYRIMYDVIHEDRVILVLGVVQRSDLQRWLQNR